MKIIPGAERVRHPAQAGRLSWHDSLFQTVPQVPPPAIEMIPLPEVCDSDMGEFDAVEDEAAWRVML